jgi:hypothetical protein
VILNMCMFVWMIYDGYKMWNKDGWRLWYWDVIIEDGEVDRSGGRRLTFVRYGWILIN